MFTPTIVFRMCRDGRHRLSWLKPESAQFASVARSTVLPLARLRRSEGEQLKDAADPGLRRRFTEHF
jgi:hypothetical protein